MRLLDSLPVRQGNTTKTIELCCGDLTALSPADAVDVLVVSAFPNNYVPTRTSLIGALDRKGISVGELARHKAVDLRGTHSCWISHRIDRQGDGIQFRRVLCFEPHDRGRPTEVVGDIFRSLVPFVADDLAVTTVAMPLVACGNVGEQPEAMLPALVEAAVHWMSLDFPLHRLKIVIKDKAEADRLRALFAELKAKYAPAALPAPDVPQYDVFLSYSRRNAEQATFLLEELRKRRPGLRIFYDQLSIKPGAAWQHDIYAAIESCRTFWPLYSPDYLGSKVCLEEFHLAKFCNRESGTVSLFPIYLFSSQLPAYLRMLNYIDCREGDRNKLRAACTQLLAHF
jgi:hypothetical protein